MQVLEENMSEFLYNMGTEKVFLSMIQNPEAIKDCLAWLHRNSFFKMHYQKGPYISKIKRQMINWEKVFAQYITQRTDVLKYREL